MILSHSLLLLVDGLPPFSAKMELGCFLLVCHLVVGQTWAWTHATGEELETSLAQEGLTLVACEYHIITGPASNRVLTAWAQSLM